MSEFMSLSPLSNMARSSGLAEKSKALAGETLELAARIDSDIRAEIRENEETLQMIGPMRAIDALSKSTAVSSLANAGMNVLGNVMSLARTVRTTAAMHAASMDGAGGCATPRAAGPVAKAIARRCAPAQAPYVLGTARPPERAA